MTRTLHIPAWVLISSLLLPCASHSARESIQPFQADIEYYAKRQADPANKKGFIATQALMFRSYPHLDRAHRLVNERRFKEARKEFEAYISLVPDDIRTRVSYLVLLDEMSLNAEVIAQAEIITARWPGFLPAYLYKGLAYQKSRKPDLAYAAFSTAVSVRDIRREDLIFARSMAAELALSMNRYEDAAAQLKMITDLEKKHAWFMKTGFALEKSGHALESLQAYSEALKLAATAAERADASLAQAEAYKRLNESEQAARSFETVLANDGNNQAAMRELAHLAYLRKRYDDAEKWIMLLKRSSLRLEDRELLANLYLQKQNHAAAIPELKAIAALQGKNASENILLSLAQAYEASGKFQESEAVYTRLLGKSPQNGESHYRYANLLIKMDRLSEAGRAVSKALSRGLTDTRKADAHRSLALIYEKTGRYEIAAQELEKSLGYLPPVNGDTTLRLAVLLHRANKDTEALRYLEQILADPSVSKDLRQAAHRQKSLLFEKSGQFSEAAAALEKALALSGDSSGETLLRLAILKHAAGKPDEALHHLDQVLATPNLSKERALTALREKSLIFEKSGRPLEAAQTYEQLVTRGDDSPRMFLRLAQLYQAADNSNRAYALYTTVLKLPDASSEEACSADDGLGMLFMKEERIPEAHKHFSAALQRCGDTWQRHYYLGLADYRLKKWEQALQHLLLADAAKKDPATLFHIALCHKELNRPGTAIHYLQQAVKESDGAPREVRKQIYDSMGYIYADESAYDKSAAAFAQSLEIFPDSIVAMRRANVLNLAGRTNAAWQMLAEVDPSRFPFVHQVEYNDVKADLLQKMGKNAEALEVLEKNQKLAAKPSRSYAIGLLCQKLGLDQRAGDNFRAAYEQEPGNTDYALALGYACKAAGQNREAIRIFETVMSKNPDFVKVSEELGYLHMNIGNNAQAIKWFKLALDAFPLTPLGISEEGDRWQKDAERIRGEIAKLTTVVNGIAYLSYRTGKARNTVLVSGALSSGGLAGEIGLEASVRPPGIGFQNDRVLEFFGRIFGNLYTDTLKYNDDSTQAGIGIRYKLLQRENLWVSAERLIKVGKDALDEWLFRLLYSRANGLGPAFGKLNQDYSLLFGEVDYYTRSATTAAYLEARKGRTFTFRSKYTFSPHLVADARWLTPSTAGGIYLEAGLGVSTRYYFNGTRYLNYRNILDLSLHYKHGMFLNRSISNTGQYDTAILSLGFNF